MSRNLDALQRQRDQLSQQIDAILNQPVQRGDQTLLASENRRVEALLNQRTILDGQIAQAQGDQDRRAADAAAQVQLGQVGDGRTFAGFGRGADTVYARGNGQSYFRDLVATAMPGHPAAVEANARLLEHAQVVERAADDLPAQFRATRSRGAAGSLETRTNPNRTDGQGGYFVPPLWLVEQYVPLLRAGRALADRCNVDDLPGGTDTVMIPKVATGTSTAVQTADGGSVSSTDLTDASLSGPVRTIAGQQDISMQLFEQSPINFDQVVFADLIADYNQKLDVQVINGSGSSGQMAGILGVSGVNAITYTDATPTLPEMWVPLVQSISQVATKRPPFTADSVGIIPALWYWMVAQLDDDGRPLLGEQGGNGQNTIAVYDANAAEGVAGAIAGVPIVLDGNIPTNLGSGTNETRVITGRYKDVFLWEGAMRTRALLEVLSGTLQVRLQIYNYAGMIANRLPTALSVVSGTGLIPASGF